MYPDKYFRLPGCAKTPVHQSESLEALVYELSDAHADTARLAGQPLDLTWEAHLDYPRALERVGRELLAERNRAMKCHGYVNGCMCPRCLHRAQGCNVRGVTRKEVRQFITALLTPNGWVRVENDSSNHLRFWHPEQEGHRLLGVSQTPSDHRWRMNTLRDARRIWPGQPTTLRATRRGEAPSAPASAPVARLEPTSRAERLVKYGAASGVRLTEAQADALLEREGTLARGRAFVDRLVAAKRRHDAVAWRGSRHRSCSQISAMLPRPYGRCRPAR